MSLKLFGLISLSLVLASCGLFQKYDDENLNSYVTGKDLKVSSAQEIRQGLSRFGFMGGGNYELKVVPITLPLLQAETRELQQMRGLTKAQFNKIVNQQRAKYTDGKVCIDFEFSVVKFKQASPVKAWKAEIVAKDGTAFPVTWERKDLRKRAVSTIINGLYGKESKWLNSARGCINVGLPLQDGFSVRLMPKFVQWPFPPSATLSWGGVESESFQNYRGY